MKIVIELDKPLNCCQDSRVDGRVNRFVSRSLQNPFLPFLDPAFEIPKPHLLEIGDVHSCPLSVV